MSQSNSPTPAPRILVIEDSPTQAEKLQYILEGQGYRVELAQNGQQGLASIAADPPALVISDIVMPEMDGYEVCQRLRAQASTRDLPVILLTGLSNQQDVVDGLACGADGFITKPYSAEYLLAHIRRTLADRATAPAERDQVELPLPGSGRMITANPQRMVSLLLSTYEAAVYRNEELTRTQDKLTALNENLETLVAERTAALSADILERKRVERALRDLEGVLEKGSLQAAIFNSAYFSSIATDEKGVIQIFNAGAQRMLGYSADEVVNKVTPADLSDPLEVRTRAQALSRELGTAIEPGFEALAFKASRGIEDIYELTYIRADGSRFPAVVSVTGLRDAQNVIIGYLLIGTDNTARKAVEAEQKRLDQRLRDQQFYMRSLIDANVDALMMTDPAGIITDLNHQVEVLTGCTRAELIGTPFKDSFTDPRRAEAGIELVLSEKKITDYELTAKARGGCETVVSVNATTFYDRDRRLQGVFAAARDVTERNRLDSLLKEQNVELDTARALAEKANLAKSEFLSSMSHELRSPLNAILGFAQLLESEVPPPSAPQALSISQILKAGWHLLTLINEILDLAKVESGLVPLSEEPVGLNEVLLECHAMIEPQARQRELTLLLPAPDRSPFVRADRTRVKQILINLLSNAIKYNRRQGTVAVTFSEPTPGRIRVGIRDTGQGLAPEQLAQLFQAFNRLGQEAGGKEGTGIGLVVAKRLVELMGGAIGVESTVGVGSVFWFELNAVAGPAPAPEAPVPAPTPDPAAPPGSRNQTLLYIEDNPANLKLVEEIIARRSDLRLLTALDGNTGIERARAARPDVILLDINLPDINGFQVLSILRSEAATAAIPVLAISANAMAADIERGLRAGFLGYITKPIKVTSFIEVLDAALDRAARQGRST